MNISKLQTLLGSPFDDAPTSRRDALRKTGKLGAGLAMAALPAMALPKVSFAQSQPSVIEVLNYALKLEYLEESYYRQALNSGVIPADEVAAFALPAEQEAKHVAFLTTAIEAVGGNPVEFTDEDFNFQLLGLEPFDDFSDFLLLLMGFEDLGVRAYKGAAPYIPRDLTTPAGINVLTAALQLHAIESRHASYVRFERAAMGVSVAPWVILDDSDAYPSAFAPIYGSASAPSGYPLPQFPPAENTTQLGVDLTTLTSPDGDPFNATEASASFDEPLGIDAVLAIADPFIVADEPA